MARRSGGFGLALERFSSWATRLTGSTAGFSFAALLILLWLVTGPVFDYSNTWQLVINTATTIVTFLMVFLIQRSQNKESLAVQLKLNELVAAMEGASNRLIDIEDLSEQDLETIGTYYRRLAEMAKKEIDIKKSHSIEEAGQRHSLKTQTGVSAPKRKKPSE